MINNPGQRASEPEYFGKNSRYGVYPIFTKHKFVEWVVADSEKINEKTGLPSIIRQHLDRHIAIRGLI